MKTTKLFALVGTFLTLMAIQPTKLYSEQVRPDDYPNYVVIGAFSIHKNAIRFTSHAHRDLKMDAKFELNRGRKLYYVYVLSTPDRTEAIAVANKLRAESEFTDTWVYCGSFSQEANQNVSSPGLDINPTTRQKIDNVSTSDHKEGNVSPGSSGENQSTDQTVHSSATSSVTASNSSTPHSASTPGDTGTTTTTPGNTTTTTSNTPVEKIRDASTEMDNGIEGKRFFFKIFRVMDSTSVEGDVDAIDTEKLRKLATYKGNAPVKIPPPSGKMGGLSLVCQVFGYRKVQRDIDYNNPQGEGIAPDGEGRVVIPFELMRLQKGDIAVMYNVYFFKDAAIMRPESRYEVTSLLEMLNENKNYKIKIHGHTNGGAAGKIISMGKDSESFFALNNTKEGFGSAKELSKERAEIIRDFLVNNGVDTNRMQIKAWGGKRAIHDKHSTRAQENVRVEIEILEQ